MRRELSPFGIQVCLLDSGGVATPIWNKGAEEDLTFVSPLYRDVLLRNLRQMVAGGNRGLNPDTAALRIFKLTRRRRLPTNYILSKTPFGALPAHLPRRVLDFLIKLNFHLNYGGSSR